VVYTQDGRVVYIQGVYYTHHGIPGCVLYPPWYTRVYISHRCTYPGVHLSPVHIPGWCISHLSYTRVVYIPPELYPGVISHRCTYPGVIPHRCTYPGGVCAVYAPWVVYVPYMLPGWCIPLGCTSGWCIPLGCTSECYTSGYGPPVGVIPPGMVLPWVFVLPFCSFLHSLYFPCCSFLHVFATFRSVKAPCVEVRDGEKDPKQPRTVRIVEF